MWTAWLRCFLLSGRDEHFQHAFGHHVAAHRVAGREHHADEADDAQQRAVGRRQCDHRADQHDSMNEVGSRHERRVQDYRHARDDLIAGESGQHEDIKRDDAVDHVDCPSTVLRVASCLIWPSCVSTAPAKTSSFQSMASSPLARAGFNKLNKFRAYISLAWYGSEAGKLRGPTIFTLP